MYSFLPVTICLNIAVVISNVKSDVPTVSPTRSPPVLPLPISPEPQHPPASPSVASPGGQQPTAQPSVTPPKSGVCNINPNTYYTLTSQHGGNLAVTVLQAETGNPKGQAVHIIEADGESEKFSFQKAPFSRVQAVAYAILSKQHSLSLTVEEDSVENLVNITVQPYTGRKSQLFQVSPTSDGYCRFKAVHSGKYLGTHGAPDSDGDEKPVSQLSEEKGPNVAWKINEALCDPYPNQPYRIVHRLSKLVLGIETGSKSDGEHVKLLHEDETADHAQVTFTVRRDVKNAINVLFRHSGSRIHLTSEDFGALLVHYFADNIHALFQVAAAKGGWCLLRGYTSQRYVVPKKDSSGEYAIGNEVILADFEPTPDAHFRFEHISFIPDQTKSYRLRNLQSDKYAEVKLASKAPDHEIVQGPYNAEAQHQLWSIVPRSNNVYYLRANHSGLMIQVDDNEDMPAKQQNQNQAADNNNQLFSLEDPKNRTKSRSAHIYRIQSTWKNLDLMPVDEGIGGVKSDLDNLAHEWEIEPDVKPVVPG